MRSFVHSLTRWDTLFFKTIFGWNGRRFLAVGFPWISHSGDGYYYPLLVPLVYLGEPDKALPFVLSALAAFGLELPAYKFVKAMVKRGRPCETLTGVQRRTTSGDRFSFPSGHTAAACLVATLISHFFPALFSPAYAWALSVGVSRIYLGVHYPTDILAGIVLGVLSALGGMALFC